MRRTWIWLVGLGLLLAGVLLGFLVGRSLGREEGRKQGLAAGTELGSARTWVRAEARAELVQLRATCATGYRILFWAQNTGGILGDPSGTPAEARLFHLSGDVLDRAEGFISYLTSAEIRESLHDYFVETMGQERIDNESFFRLCMMSEDGTIEAGIVPEELDPGGIGEERQ
jgi:hypothetical protein